MTHNATPVDIARKTKMATPGLDALRGVRVARLASVPFFLVSQLQVQVEQLAAYGMEVQLVSGEGPELSRLHLGPRLRYTAIEFVRPICPWKDIKTLWQLILLFARERPEIVHSTTPKTGLLAAIAGFVTHIPVRLHTFTGQPWLHRRGLVRRLARAADRLIGMLNTRCYADSHSQRQFLIEEGLIPAAKLCVLGGGSLAGVDITRFDRNRWTENERQHLRQKFSVGPGAKVILFLGRIARDKGIQELLTAFEQLVVEGYDCHLLLVGPSDEECGGESFLLSGAPRAAVRIHAIGYTDCPERYLAFADLLCLPSYREGFGTVVIEAAAMGVPTVGTRINGLKDAVVDGETGMLVEPHDAKALHEALAMLLSSPDQLSRLGQAAFERVRRLFDARHVNRLLAEEYLQLLMHVRHRA